MNLTTENSDYSSQGIEGATDTCVATVYRVVLYGLASIGLVALCIAAGFLWAIYR